MTQIESHRISNKKYRLNHKDKIKEWIKKNKDRVDESKKRWYLKNKEIVSERNKLRYLKNIEEYRIKHREDYYKNRDTRIKKVKEYYYKNKKIINYKCRIALHTNVERMLRHKIRTTLNKYIRRNNIKDNYSSCIKYLGCSTMELKQYLENKWDSTMNWGNYGKYPNGWDIDHIKPLSSFKLVDKVQFLEAFHYTNLQPLNSKINRDIKKNHKIF